MSFGIPVRNGLGVGLLASTFLSSLRIGGRPAMSLDFIGTNSLDSRVTFTRATTATFTGSNGLIQTAAINAPRFDYDPVTLAPKGLLIEEARTNLALYSEQFDNALWVKTNATITADATTSPDGTTNADKLIADAVLSQHRVNFTTVSTAGTYSFSVYLKAAGYNFALLRIGTVGGWVDLTNGTITGVVGGYTMTATLVGNGWYRVVLAGAAALNDILRINVSDTVLVTDFSGNGTSGIFLWGAQYEVGAFATSYIPTTLLAATRNADVPTMTGTNFSSWFNPVEGSFVAQFSGQGTSGTYAFAASDGASYYISTSFFTAPAIRSVANSAAGFNFVSTTGGAVGAVNKTAFGYKTNDLAASTNGGAPATTGTATLPTVDRLTIGSYGAFAYINGHIRSINYYNTRLPNTTLRALSA